MTEPEPFSCRLTPKNHARREPRDRALGAQLRHQWWDGERAAVLGFPADAAPLVDGFVREESQCCPFFAFEVRREPGTVKLHVSTPPGGEHMLAQLVDAFESAGR